MFLTNHGITEYYSFVRLFMTLSVQYKNTLGCKNIFLTREKLAKQNYVYHFSQTDKTLPIKFCIYNFDKNRIEFIFLEITYTQKLALQMFAPIFISNNLFGLYSFIFFLILTIDLTNPSVIGRKCMFSQLVLLVTEL